MKKIILLILLFLSTIFSQTEITIVDAYNTYLAGNYSKSEVMYRELYQKYPLEKDPIYGVVNSLQAVGKYREALSWCDTLLNKNSDYIMENKKLYLSALTGKKKLTDLLFTNFTNKYKLDTLQKSNLQQKVGWGFYYGGDFKDATKWFVAASKFCPESQQIISALSSSRLAQKNKHHISADVMGGPFIYSQSIISTYKNEIKSSYKIKNGYYFQQEASILLNYHSKITLFASQFSAKLINLKDEIGVNFLDTLFAFYGEYPKEGDLYSKVISKQNGFWDTAFVTYNYQNPNSDNSDTVIIIKYSPYNSYQDNIYLSYELISPNNRNFSLGFGANYTFNTNVSGTENGISFWLKNGHTLPFMDIVFNWYYTNSSDLKFIQISPDLYRAFLNKKILLKISPTYLWKAGDTEGYSISDIQLSVNTALSYTAKSLSLAGSVNFGKQSFILKNSGKSQLSVMQPHRFSGSVSVGVRPFKKKRATIYLLGIYELFDDMSRALISAGINLNL